MAAKLTELKVFVGLEVLLYKLYSEYTTLSIELYIGFFGFKVLLKASYIVPTPFCSNRKNTFVANLF